MNCKAEGVIKNFRYRILTVDERKYILDIDKPFIVYLFPFIFWFLPHSIYQIDGNTLKQLKVPKVEKVKFSPTLIISMGLIYPISSSLFPVFDHFDIPVNLTFRIIILVIGLAVMICLRLYISNIGKGKLQEMVTLEKRYKQTILIRPKSIFYILKYVVGYFSALLFVFLSVYIFLVDNKLFALLCFYLTTFIWLALNMFVVTLGDYRIKGNFIK